MEEQAGVRSVVMGDEDDGALGVGRPELGDDVVALRCGKRSAAAGRPGGRSSAAAAPTTAADRRAKRAPAAQGGDPRGDARAGGQAEWPPEGAVHRLGLDPRVGRAQLAQAPGQPLRRHPLPWDAVGRWMAASVSTRWRSQSPSR